MRRQKIKVPNTHRLGSGKVHKSAVPMAKDYCFLGLDGEDERVMNVFRGVFGWVKIDKIQGIKSIMGDIFYSPDIKFIAFDIEVDGQLVNQHLHDFYFTWKLHVNLFYINYYFLILLF